MAGAIDYQRLRQDIGLQANDTTSLSDVDAEAIFVEAGESYSDAASIKASTRILALQRLMAQAALQTNYTQNNSREENEKIFGHYADLLKLWGERLGYAVGLSSGSAARFGRSRRKPARIKEHPNGNGAEWGW